MSKPSPRVCIVVSSVNQSATLGHLLDSLFSQEQIPLRIQVIDAGTQNDAMEQLQAYESRRLAWQHVGVGEQAAAVEQAFNESECDYLWWLSGADKLCPWAVRLGTFVMDQLPEVQWLTSSTPLLWTPTQLCASGGLADGYARRAFFAGRNLKTSAYFHFPIWRAGTLWRRSLWEKSGAKVRFSLQEAGDFELWSRLFHHAELYTLNIPMGGQQVSAVPVETDTYWQMATRHLESAGKLDSPSPLALRVQRQLVRRIPSLRKRYTEPAPQIWISPPTMECRTSRRPIL